MRCWRTPPRSRRWLALVPAAVLAACTPADRAPQARPESAPPPPAAEAAVAQADAKPNCQPPSSRPPAVPDTAFRVNGPTKDWSHVVAFVATNAIAFPAAAGEDSTVVPCMGCVQQRLRVRTETRTTCLDSAMAAANELRFVGAAVQYPGDTVPLKNRHLGFGGDNATDSVYLMVQGNRAYAMFRSRAGNIKFVPYQAGGSKSGWAFVFNSDGMSGAAQARWRPETMSTASSGVRRDRFAALERGGPAAPGDEADALQTGVSFAWMACAAGCCQFHGSGDGGMGGQDDQGGHHGGGNPPPPPPGPPGNPGPPHP